MRRMVYLVFVAGILSLAGAPARAASCGSSWEGQPAADTKAAADACTSQIQAGNLSGEELELAYLGRGAAYNHLHQYSSAIADLNQAIALKPDDALAYDVRGDVEEKMGNSAAADADHAKAKAIEPGEF